MTKKSEVVWDEEWHSANPSPEVARQIDRLVRRARSLKPPSDFMVVEQYRAWLLERVEAHGASDETDAERAETSNWKARIVAATDAELWAEYQPYIRAPYFVQTSEEFTEAYGYDSVTKLWSDRPIPITLDGQPFNAEQGDH